MWKVASASRMILAACDDRMREFLQKLGTAPNRLVEHKVGGGDDRPFIVLAETKPSKRHIPVWARYSPLRVQ
jgi:hypothetical protein